MTPKSVPVITGGIVAPALGVDGFFTDFSEVDLDGRRFLSPVASFEAGLSTAEGAEAEAFFLRAGAPAAASPFKPLDFSPLRTYFPQWVA